jgi:Uma2 family endonuclease
VAPDRFRVPDVCLTTESHPEQVFRTPPFACIEVLSPDDRLSEMQERVADYLYFGVPFVWIVDPETRKAWQCSTAGMLQVTELRTESPATVVPIADLFED